MLLSAAAGQWRKVVRASDSKLGFGRQETNSQPVSHGPSTPLYLVVTCLTVLHLSHRAIVDHMPRSLCTCLTHHVHFVLSCVGPLVTVLVCTSPVRPFGLVAERVDVDTEKQHFNVKKTCGNFRMAWEG